MLYFFQKSGPLFIIMLLAATFFLFTLPAAAADFNPADTAALIDAIVQANDNGEADVINLTANFTYNLENVIPLTSNGLPIIISEITINGNGAVLTRSSTATDKFRILQVAIDGNLTLNQVTISNGVLEGETNSLSSGGGIYNEGNLTISQCNIENNQADPENGAGGGIASSGQLTITNSTISHNLGLIGGGITNKEGTVTCSDSEISSNQAMMGCGIINFGGSMTMTGCNIRHNLLPSDPVENYMMSGGGIINLISDPNNPSVILFLTDCTIDDNLSLYGGGIANGLILGTGDNVIPGGIITINRCTISNNKALFSGAGISNLLGTIGLTNSTISGNVIEAQAPARAPRGDDSDWSDIYDTGGGCINLGQMTIDSCTISNNTAPVGGGLYTLDNSLIPDGIDIDIFTRIKNTIVAGNQGTTGPDCSGPFSSYGYNLVGSEPGDPAEYVFSEEENSDTDIFGQDPLLEPLAGNGGPTYTHALQAGSPAIDHGTCSKIDGTPVSEDQRGEIRPHLADGICDIGAYECPCLDGTGVPPETQDDGPNQGDGNGDGILDSRQRNVASLPSATGSGYLTVEISGDGCNQLSQVRTYSYESIGAPDPGYTYPFGLVAFEIGCSPVTVRIYYHGAANIEDLIYRKYGPTPADWAASTWYSMPGTSYGTKEIDGNQVPYIEFTLTEGELGDDTNAPPIVDQGGPAAGAAVPTLNEWGLIIMTLLLAGFSLAAISRQRQSGNG